MEKEIKIILYPELHKSKNGRFFEGLMRPVFESEGYTLSSNIEFTGLEIDIYGNHNIRNEKLLVECKAKKKPLATEVKLFLYNILTDNLADHGYFVYTTELDHGAAGIKEQTEKDPKRNKKVTFLGPSKVIDILVRKEQLALFTIGLLKGRGNCNKLLLAYTYFGVYYIAITSVAAEKRQFHVFNAKSLNSINDLQTIETEIGNINIIEKLISGVSELKELIHFEIYNSNNSLFNEDVMHIEFSVEFSSFLEDVNSNFTHPKIDKLSLNDLYVAPNLSSIEEEIDAKKKIISKQSIHDIINDSNSFNIAVFGDNVSGKTSFCKDLISDLFRRDFIPIYLTGNSIGKNIRTDRLSKFIIDQFKKQYHSNKNLNDLSTDKLIIIIDDFQLSAKGTSDLWGILLDNICEISNKIIIVSDCTYHSNHASHISANHASCIG